ncbi:hypothetical protein SCLCIDRAFT_32912 [Scleroderma citrinum Foug A]|uniref:Uncharacterized protein n=1 Tax=Scleroderma citrinum Foug A TaxID=1036808 RepID=A0A0C2ZH43_9AGAM|nr:hypothetical protein SCLCIDRAFT_32912 [Scleroderma citrinum Foug A]
MQEQEQAFKERENILQQQHEQQQTILQQQYEGICQEVVHTAVSQQSDAVTGLQSLLREREGELSGVREVLKKIQSSQQETAQQHDVQLAELHKQFEFILEQAMRATHVAVILRTRTGPAYEEESMKTDYPDVRNEYGTS